MIRGQHVYLNVIYTVFFITFHLKLIKVIIETPELILNILQYVNQKKIQESFFRGSYF